MFLGGRENGFFGLFSFLRRFGAILIMDALVVRTEDDQLEKTACRYLFPVLRKLQKKPLLKRPP